MLREVATTRSAAIEKRRDDAGPDPLRGAGDDDGLGGCHVVLLAVAMLQATGV